MFGFVEKQGKKDNSEEQNQATHTQHGGLGRERAQLAERLPGNPPT